MIIDNYFNHIANKEESLTSLNTAFASEGAYINIPKSKVADKPIEIMYFSTGSEAALLVQPRNLVIIGENSHVQIIERHQSLNENAVLTNAVTEIFAEKRELDSLQCMDKQKHLREYHTWSLNIILQK
jgi:Fe-S cluster assembly protein SufD